MLCWFLPIELFLDETRGPSGVAHRPGRAEEAEEVVNVPDRVETAAPDPPSEEADVLDERPAPGQIDG